jgi:H+/Cl- antiporter ClcA
VMRMPITVMLIMLSLSNPELLPIAILASVTGFLSATLLEAGNARKAMVQSSEKRRELYGSKKSEASG